MEINGILKHFGITDDDVNAAKHLHTATNGQYFKKEMGVTHFIKKHEEEAGELPKGTKVRIIIDYDADFPEIVARIIFTSGGSEGNSGEELYGQKASKL